MAKRKYFQLVEHNQTKWVTYAIHEALVDTSESLQPFWVGSEPIRVFDNYQTAMGYWTSHEKLSSVLDVLSYDEAEPLFDRVDYSDITELDFD